MKYIKSINEYLNSEKYTYVKWISKSILKDLKKINIMPYYINSTGFSLSFDVDFDIDKPLLVKIRRVKPLKFVYHQTSDTNINDILKNGLIPKDSSNWTDKDKSLEYPPAIFCTNINLENTEDLFYGGESPDKKITLKIDTSKIKNVWFNDLHFMSDKHIMTFEPIPPDAISILDISKLT